MAKYSQHIVDPIPIRAQLSRQIEVTSATCVQCQVCVNECRFLQLHGDPKFLADNYNPADDFLHIPFECSMCELCTAVCPHGVEPPKLFLEMRREAFNRGQNDLPQHRGLRNYEKKGTSKRFSWYALPENCDTIFFPGCALSGSRSETTLKVFESLQRCIPAIGIVLDCCTKPSHDLGDEEYFLTMFGEMTEYLQNQGVKTILLACPNCDKVFKTYADEFNIQTVYEILAQIDAPAESVVKTKTVVLHDPCTARFNYNAQKSVRDLLNSRGILSVEPPHSGKNTLCCGEGGAVNCFKPKLASHWSQKRTAEACGQPIVSYCAGCTQILGKYGKTDHVLDLLFGETAQHAPVARAPLTYFKRLKLKKHLQQHLAAATTRERTFPVKQRQKSGREIIFFLLGFMFLLVPGLIYLL